MTKKNIVLWVCDYSRVTGEGNLARKFIKDYFTKKNIKILKLDKKSVFNQKYIIPIIGIIHCWKSFLKGHKVGYINYLPLWNFLIFIFLPPKTILGPITGGAQYSDSLNLNYFCRRFFFPIFYKISEFFLNLRYKKNINFSTDLLKKFLSKKIIKKSKFNYVLKDFKFLKKERKNIDFLIYYRLHKNKLASFNHNLIKSLIRLRYKVFVIGDKLKIKGVKNLGYINRQKLMKLQSISKYTICSNENIYSLFVLECISNHVKILINRKNLIKVNYLKKYFIPLSKINFKNK